jgi:hypothetical protein
MADLAGLVTLPNGGLGSFERHQQRTAAWRMGVLADAALR